MFKHAYGAGYRAGRAPSVFIEQPDGTKVIGTPACPYAGRYQFISRLSWQNGWEAGMKEKLSTKRSA